TDIGAEHVEAFGFEKTKRGTAATTEVENAFPFGTIEAEIMLKDSPVGAEDIALYVFRFIAMLVIFLVRFEVLFHLAHSSRLSCRGDFPVGKKCPIRLAQKPLLSVDFL